MRWTAASAAVVTALQFVQLAVLARLLDPEAFGLMALVSIVLGFAQHFGQMGLSEAVIQRKDPTREELSSLYWLNVAFSIVAFLVLWIASPLIARVLGTPQLGELLSVAALAFLIGPFGFQFRALAQKALRFRLLARVDIVTTAVTLAVAVSSAWLFEQGVWSLVWGHLAGATVEAVLLVTLGWREGSARPRFHFRGSDLAGYLSFGLYRAGTGGVNFFNRRAPQLFVGALLGTQALGYYSVAENLVLQSRQRLNMMFKRVAFPVFSEVQDDVARLRRGYFEMIHLLMLSNAPVLIGAAAVAPTAVPLLLGEKWTETVPLVQVLALYALARSLGSANGSLFMARGRADWSFRWQVESLLMVLPTIYLVASLSGDVVYLAWSLLFVQLMLALTRYRRFTRKLIGPGFLPYVRAAGTPILLAGVMAIVVLGVGVALADLPGVMRLGAQVLVGIASYASLLWLFEREALLGAVNMLWTRGRGYEKEPGM